MNTRINNFFNFFIILILLTATIGFSVVKHYCSSCNSNEISINSFSCCDHNIETHLHEGLVCCDFSNENKTSFNDDCCDNFENRIKTDNFISCEKFKIPKLNYIVNNIIYQCCYSNYNIDFSHTNIIIPPPKGIHLNLLNCILLI